MATKFKNYETQKKRTILTKIDHSLKTQIWSNFHKKPLSERISFFHQKTQQKIPFIKKSPKNSIKNNVLDKMTENLVATLKLPYSIVPHLVINGKHRIVPLSVEEPSVVAAVSAAAKLVATCGGFFADSTGNVMTGQMVFYGVEWDGLDGKLNGAKEELVSVGNGYCEGMVKRGGGIVGISWRKIEPEGRECYLVVEIDINVCDAMGANIVNTLCEKLSPEIQKLTEGEIGIRILTNFCRKRRSKAGFAIPLSKLAWKGLEGGFLARKILNAYYFAVDDDCRAVTNNKGVMNGIDSVAVACGQDWRAIESAAHSYAALKGVKRGISPLVDYKIENINSEEYLVAEMEMPIAVGVVGGSLGVHPTYQLSQKVLDFPTAKELSVVLIAVGICSNFAALRALAVEGIQKGHMELHKRKFVKGENKVLLLIL